MPKVAEVKAQVERIWLATFQRSLAATVTQQVRQHALAGVQAALETALVEELHAYRTQWDAAQPPFTCLPPALQRSGSYTRKVLTSYGYMKNRRVTPALAPGRNAGSAGGGQPMDSLRFTSSMPPALADAQWV